MLKSGLTVLCLLGSHAALAADDYAVALRDWAIVLEKFVDDQGRVAFTALAQDRGDLDKFIDYLARISPANAPEQFDTPAKTMAYHINTYNALAMHGIIDKGIPSDFDSFFKRAGFFKFRKVTIGGKKTSLYDYENKVIRPLGEPRVHFALNCMVRDCPRLPRKPFMSGELDRQLQAATVEFFANDKHLRIENDKREVLVSEILRFYTKDFVESNKRQDLIEYINQYRADSVPADYKVRFIPYDWTINSQP
jgi:hypothetical protein